MDPRPVHKGGSVSANAGAELAALISARGTSVCTRRNTMFGWPFAAGVRQSGISAGSEASAAAVSGLARVMTLVASSVASAVPANAETPVETSSLCDREDVAMSSSQNRTQTQLEIPMHLTVDR